MFFDPEVLVHADFTIGDLARDGVQLKKLKLVSLSNLSFNLSYLMGLENRFVAIKLLVLGVTKYSCASVRMDQLQIIYSLSGISPIMNLILH